MTEVDPFADTGDIDPGEVPEKEYRQMSKQKSLAAGAQPLLTNQNRPRLSEYAESGNYTPLQKLAGMELSIESSETIDTKFGPALKLCLYDETNTAHVVCTSAKNIVTAFEAFNEAVANGEQEYPIVAVFNKIQLDGGNTCWVIS